MTSQFHLFWRLCRHDFCPLFGSLSRLEIRIGVDSRSSLATLRRQNANFSAHFRISHFVRADFEFVNYTKQEIASKPAPHTAVFMFAALTSVGFLFARVIRSCSTRIAGEVFSKTKTPHATQSKGLIKMKSATISTVGTQVNLADLLRVAFQSSETWVEVDRGYTKADDTFAKQYFPLVESKGCPPVSLGKPAAKVGDPSSPAMSASAELAVRKLRAHLQRRGSVLQPWEFNHAENAGESLTHKPISDGPNTAVSL